MIKQDAPVPSSESPINYRYKVYKSDDSQAFHVIGVSNTSREDALRNAYYRYLKYENDPESKHARYVVVESHETSTDAAEIYDAQ